MPKTTITCRECMTRIEVAYKAKGKKKQKPLMKFVDSNHFIHSCKNKTKEVK